MDSVKYRIFLLQEDGGVKHLLDTTKASLSLMGRKMSRQFKNPVIAVIEHNDGKTERFRYLRGRLMSRDRQDTT